MARAPSRSAKAINMSERLSRSDHRILKILQSEADISNVELADRIGLSPSPCLRRVNQLKEDGIITGYVAILDRRTLGLDVVSFVEVQVDRHNEATDSAFRAAILREPEVVGCYVTTGHFDYVLKVVAADLNAYAAFTMQRLLKMPGVKDVRSSLVLDIVKDSTALPLGHLE